MSAYTVSEIDSFVTSFKWDRIDDTTCNSAYDIGAAAEKIGFSLFDKILRSVAKHCEFYLSDICYEVKAFSEHADSIDQHYNTLDDEAQEDFQAHEHVVSLFGIRKCGVDGNDFVLSRVNNGEMKEYKELFYIGVKVEKTDSWYHENEYHFTLYRKA